MKTIYVKPTLVRDVSVAPSGTWEPYIIAFDIMIHSQFELNVLVHDNNVYLKPTKPHLNGVFEQLFNFGISCKDYDENKIIKVTSPVDYYKYFKNSS